MKLLNSESKLVSKLIYYAAVVDAIIMVPHTGLVFQFWIWKIRLSFVGLLKLNFPLVS